LLATVIPLATAQAIYNTTALSVTSLIAFEKVYFNETVLPPLSLDVTVAAVD